MVRVDWRKSPAPFPKRPHFDAPLAFSAAITAASLLSALAGIGLRLFAKWKRGSTA